MDYHRLRAERGDEKSIAFFENAPQVPAGLAGNAYACFRDIGGERHVGMGSGPLPYRAVRTWARDHGIRDPDGFDDLLAVVQHMDGIWLKDAAAKVKSAASGGQTPAKRPGKSERNPPKKRSR